MSLQHYVKGTFFTTEQFRLLVDSLVDRIEKIKKSSAPEHEQQIDSMYENIWQKLYCLTDHD
jgi:hypothetical protein